ncbi:ABC transporter ATP-binding protein [Citricoccus sp. SGAir0253]|uniref:ABC transporter ATP-binding protein n=1 Tax=Citricoccus sp. SGAir0253 TaxID=2567881 RepID=UPI0010CCF1D8|nr:ABC transporter ATP-binding protein [Citricoccus sp. SGAir0253]QCU78404.1 ABC transporter ATP-binding protein [Citricoccus sp. SGAir0253]
MSAPEPLPGSLPPPGRPLRVPDGAADRPDDRRTDDRGDQAADGPSGRDGEDLPDPHFALAVRGLAKRFGERIAVDGLSLDVPAGSFYGLVGPNGAGKTTAMSMVTGLLRPDHGRAWVHGTDVWAEPLVAKRRMGVLADGVRLFDRLTGEQLVTYAGLLRGLDRQTVARRTADLLRVLDLAADAGRLVVDYSAGMTKKVALACALVHAPRVLVLDEPFEAVDPVSAATIRALLAEFVASGGTVVVSSHVMDLVQRMCDHVAVIARGTLLAAGTVDEVRRGRSLEERFVELVGGAATPEGLTWLHT